jgi:hypothetical protein
MEFTSEQLGQMAETLAVSAVALRERPLDAEKVTVISEGLWELAVLLKAGAKLTEGKR